MGRYSTFKGWVEVGGKTCYFRSHYEVYYARFLELLKQQNKIWNWEYDSPTFYFEGIKRGVTNTKLDFTVYMSENEPPTYVEVKGDWDNKSLTRIKRFKKYYPELKLALIDNERKKRADGTYDLGFFDKLRKTLGDNHWIFAKPIIAQRPTE